MGDSDCDLDEQEKPPATPTWNEKSSATLQGDRSPESCIILLAPDDVLTRDSGRQRLDRDHTGRLGSRLA